MRIVPDRPAALQITSVFGGFFLGPYLALRMSMHFTPGSELVQTTSVLGFALVFVGGTLVWTGLGIAAVVLRAFRSLLRGRLPGSDLPIRADDRIVPPGYGSYVVLGLLAGAGVGSTAAVASELTWAAALALWTAAGLGYGLLLWAAARHGYLPFHEPD